MSEVKDKMLKKAKIRMDVVEHLMDNNAHVHDPELVLFCLDSARALWSILDEADRDYLDAATFAFKEKMTWGSDKQ